MIKFHMSISSFVHTYAYSLYPPRKTQKLNLKISQQEQTFLGNLDQPSKGYLYYTVCEVKIILMNLIFTGFQEGLRERLHFNYKNFYLYKYDQFLLGALAGHKVAGLRFCLVDGANHPVDSTDYAFQLAAEGAMKQVLESGAWHIIEPVMSVEVTVPDEFQCKEKS